MTVEVIIHHGGGSHTHIIPTVSQAIETSIETIPTWSSNGLSVKFQQLSTTGNFL